MTTKLDMTQGADDPMPCIAKLDNQTLQIRQTDKTNKVAPANLVILDFKQADALREFLNKYLPR